MKAIFTVLASLSLFALGSCDRHTWDDEEGKKNGTKRLFQHGGDHGDGDKADHGAKKTTDH